MQKKQASNSFPIALVAISGIFLLLILPLIGSIHGITFQPARTLEFAAAPAFAGPPAVSPGWAIVTLAMRVVTVLAVLLFLLQIITSRSHRRIYLAVLLVFGAILIVTDVLNFDQLPAELVNSPEPEDLWEKPIEMDLNLPTNERAVEASMNQYAVLAIALSSLVVLAGGMLYWRLYQMKKPRQAADEQADILETITDAAHRLRSGEDAHTVVLFCYQEMIRILGTAGRIDVTYLTPREFEHRLRALGLSGVSSADLTQLFEIVRYAGRVDADFSARALRCLDAIQEAHAWE